jgi:hypothetical protein
LKGADKKENIMDGKCVSSEKGAKSKGEAEDLENPELERQIASLVKQPRMIELMERLKSMAEAVK